VLSLLVSACLFAPLFVNAAQPLGCLIEPERIAEIGSQVIGIVEHVHVERGDVVRKGQVLATLRADVERASVQVASTRSQVEAEVRSAEANLKLARITQKRQEGLVAKKFISEQALDKAIADTEIAAQRLALSKEQLRTSSSELSLARAQLDQRTIRAPIDGIITDRYVWPGERVEEKALFRIAKTNPLRVEMVISATSYGTITRGMQLSVAPQLPNMQALDATVTLVDKLIDGASNTFRVRAEIKNPDSEIPAGLRCKVELPNPSTPTVKNRRADQPEQISTIQQSMVLYPAKALNTPESTVKISVPIGKLRLDMQLNQYSTSKNNQKRTAM
jgi:cobalt-zinc-cadmium efflux system membrane fusion protein